MSDTKEEPILRMGEWFGRNKWQFVTHVEFITSLAPTQNGTTTDITFQKRTVEVLTVGGMEMMLKEYDKYLDDRLVI